jgi:hypothetical protein
MTAAGTPETRGLERLILVSIGGLAVSLATAFVLTQAATASATPWVWPKSLATYSLQKKFGGDASCVPMGAHERRNGVNYYARFDCAIGFSNGASFVVVIAPKSSTAFTLISVHQVSQGSSTLPVAPSYTPSRSYTPPSYTPAPTYTPSPTYTPPTYTPPSYTPSTSNCPSGWYVNTYGNCVPGPSTDPSLPVPGGPTAICADGTYSYSQSRSGTCSYHGGVSSWLN